MKYHYKLNWVSARNKYVGKWLCFLMISMFVLAGCSQNGVTEEDAEKEQQDIQKCLFLAGEVLSESLQKESLEINQILPREEENSGENITVEPEIIETDWSEYFDGFNGAAVVYDPSKEQYLIYHMEQALTRRPPCSTFKIISSLTALENGMIEPDNSARTWSGEVFWNENWNQDIDFAGAFRASCVWYFREVIDEVGRELMQEELDRLQYGNCDISDWEGRLNTNNNNRALTGFWIESSLKISPKEQTEVMERIFGENSVYSEETRKELKQVMLVEDQDKTTFPIYGKTGMGKENGIVVDAWFTGFTEGAEGNLYFCIYLGRTDNRDVSSTVAKEIAINIVSDYYSQNVIRK